MKCQVLETICVKCQNLFSWKNKENVRHLSHAECKVLDNVCCYATKLSRTFNTPESCMFQGCVFQLAPNDYLTNKIWSPTNIQKPR